VEVYIIEIVFFFEGKLKRTLFRYGRIKKANILWQNNKGLLLTKDEEWGPHRASGTRKRAEPWCLWQKWLVEL
jgi:hypothetical protein